MKIEREEFWSELGAIRGLWNEPWCVVRDFNMIRFPSKRSKGGRLSQAMSPSLNNRSKSRIDRFLIFEDWEAHFQGAIQTVLARPVSDHALILLDWGGLRRGPTPFRFENIDRKSVV